MAVLNVTPDSFHADSRTDGIDSALKTVAKMLNEGADWIDVGGESTRPGAEPVEVSEERSASSQSLKLSERLIQKLQYQ